MVVNPFHHRGHHHGKNERNLLEDGQECVLVLESANGAHKLVNLFCYGEDDEEMVYDFAQKVNKI